MPPSAPLPLHIELRVAALVVAQVLCGRNLDEALAARCDAQPDLTPPARAAIQFLCFGTLRRWGELDLLLGTLLSKRAEPDIEGLLACALFQLRHTDIAPHTVVDQAVRAVEKMRRPQLKGLINAVLRNALRQQEPLDARVAAEPVARYSYPMWWIDRLRDAYPEAWDAALQAGNDLPPFTLRVNRRRLTRDDYLQRLHQFGIAARPVGEDGVTLASARTVPTVPGFDEGLVSVQDLGAQYAAALLAPQSGERVLDACAAPGGKACHLLERADLDLVAVEQDAGRMNRVTQNLQRLGLRATLITADVGNIPAWWDGRPFDRILADVPCSASGVVRRHPDIKWLRRPGDLAGFARQQARLLDALWTTLKPGGVMLYCTCSIFPEENEQQIATFLSRQCNAQRLEVTLPNNSRGQLLPQPAAATDNHDGFFYALLGKTLA